VEHDEQSAGPRDAGCSASFKMTMWVSLLVWMVRMPAGPAGVVRRGLGVRAGGVVVSLT
jgi:hypothetical protein